MSDHLERPQHVRIRCAETKRLIATVDASGVHLWCKYMKQSELVTWDVIDAARKEAELQQGEKTEAAS